MDLLFQLFFDALLCTRRSDNLNWKVYVARISYLFINCIATEIHCHKTNNISSFQFVNPLVHKYYLALWVVRVVIKIQLITCFKVNRAMVGNSKLFSNGFYSFSFLFWIVIKLQLKSIPSQKYKRFREREVNRETMDDVFKKFVSLTGHWSILHKAVMDSISFFSLIGGLLNQ